MPGLFAAHYKETEDALAKDPIIAAMAEEIQGLHNLSRSAFVHDDGTPRHEFMMNALREYQSRGGTIPSHIGGPARAILRLMP